MYCAVCGLCESLKKDCTSCYKIARLVLPADPRESATFAASALPLADHSAVVVEACLRSLVGGARVRLDLALDLLSHTQTASIQSCICASSKGKSVPTVR